MAWFTLAVLVYCLLCWFAAWWVIRVRQAVGEEEVPAAVDYVRLGVILLAPLYMPFAALVYFCFQAHLYRVRQRVCTLRRINRTVREYQFIPVDGSSLGEPMRGHLDRLTPPLVDLGFQPIGDFLMKPQPVVVHDRFLINEDGTTLATVCCILQAGAVSFISVLDNGTCVHTSGSRNPHPERKLEPEDRLALTYMPDAHPCNMHREHQEAVRTVAARTGAQAIRFRPDQFRDVMVYDQRLFNRWRHRHGGLDCEPPAADFNTLVALQPGGPLPGSANCPSSGQPIPHDCTTGQ
jgi:hypothetical protein